MREFVIFRLGSDEFGIGVEKVIEIIKPPRIYSLPETEEFIAGVIAFRGEVIPLIDMRRRFGIVPVPKKERVIIIRSGFGKSGLVVDEIYGIVEFSPSEISKPYVVLRGIKTEYMSGLGKKAVAKAADSAVVIFLDVDNILSSEEKIRILESASSAPKGASG